MVYASFTTKSKRLNEFLRDVANQNARSANVYTYYLRDFEAFVEHQMKTTVDKLILQLQKNPNEAYSMASNFVNYMVNGKFAAKEINARTLSLRIKTLRQVLEVNDIPINRQKWKLRVKTPRPIERESSPITKEQIRAILQAIESPGLRTYVMFLASTGWRATESIMLRNSNFDFTTSPVRVTVPGELTKTGRDRHTYLTAEMTRQLQSWLSYKYRLRQVNSLDRKTGKWSARDITPIRKDTDFIFLPYYDNKKISLNPVRNYATVRNRFINVVKRLGITKDHSGKRHKITLHSFRRYVYTTITSFGMNQFAEYYIGHSHSTYWDKSENEIIADFQKVEPALTFVDFNQLEATTQDLQSQLGALRYENMQLKGEFAQVKQEVDKIAEFRNPIAAQQEAMKTEVAEVQKYIEFLEKKAGIKDRKRAYDNV